MNNANPLLFESNRLRRAVDNGEITNPKTIEMLKQKGWIPDEEKEATGLSKGAFNMFQKAGIDPVRIYNISNPMGSNTRFVPRKDSDNIPYLKPIEVHIPTNIHANNGLSPLQNAIVQWHEAREAVRGKFKRGSKKQKTDAAYVHLYNNSKHDPLTTHLDIQKRLKPGSHNIGVMRDEGKLATKIKNRHNFDLQKWLDRTGRQKRDIKLTPKQELRAKIRRINKTAKFIKKKDRANAIKNTSLLLSILGLAFGASKLQDTLRKRRKEKE